MPLRPDCCPTRSGPGPEFLVLPALLLVLLLASPRILVGQEGEAPVSPERAQAIRDTLTRPPPDHPFRASSFFDLPGRIVTLPVEMALKGTAEVVGFLAVPERYDPLVGAYHSLNRVGLRPSVGTSMGARGGVALFLGWVGPAPFSLESGFSVRGYQRHRVGVAVGDGPWMVRAQAAFHRYTQERFWGLGPGAGFDGRSDFGQDTWSVNTTLTGYLGEGWEVLAGGGWERTSVGPGGDPSTPDVVGRYEPGELPGLGPSSRFAVLRGGLTYRRLQWKEVRRTGVEGKARWDEYRGVGGTDVAFRRLGLNLRTYLPVTFHQHLTLRGQGWITEGARDRVPFTHLPSLGGGETLRSYEWGRFRDRVTLASSAEWRWELWRDLRERAHVEGLLFLDLGTVGESLSELGEARHSWGLGLSGRWLRDLTMSGYMAFGTEGSRLSGSITTEFR